MTKSTNRGRGGKRPGAGRPKKARPAPSSTRYASAEDYLQAVVEGSEVADAARISAARGLIAFQKRRQRAPLAPLQSPREQTRSDAQGAASDMTERFKARVIELSGGKKHD
ncbi:MAG: hypothetical protein HY661_02470 [Betaproteobacteria bacterium]|nr:hypothetical protein [Betaproteobacteria bacterium]